MLICIQGQIGLRKFKQSFPERNKRVIICPSQQLPMIINFIFRCQKGHLKSVLNDMPFIEIGAALLTGSFVEYPPVSWGSRTWWLKVSREGQDPWIVKLVPEWFIYYLSSWKKNLWICRDLENEDWTWIRKIHFNTCLANSPPKPQFLYKRIWSLMD